MREAASVGGTSRTAWLIGRALLLLCLVGGLTIMPKVMKAEVGAISLRAALADTALERGYVPATTENMERATELFARLLSGETGAAVETELAALGFELGKVEIDKEILTLVRESADRLEGKGVYVFRSQGEPVLLQAPHRFKDLDTGTITRQLMEGRPFRAAAWNTVPRWYDENGVRVDADLAHVAASYFNAFAVAFARTYPDGWVVQLHGFDRSKRTTAAGQQASAIVSAGIETPSARARNLAGCLATQLAPEPVLLYPEEVTELGGTTNQNGRALRAVGFDGFVHLELARELREKLVSDAALRGRMADCIAGL